MTKRRDDEEMIPLSTVVKWVAIVSILVGLMEAAFTGNWLLLFSIPSLPVALYVAQRRGRF